VQFSGASSNAWPFYPLEIYQPWLEEMTGGRLVLDTKIDLVPSTEMILAVIDGRADACNQRIPWVSGTFPQFDFGSLPFYFDNEMELYNTLRDPDMQKLLAREYEKIGLVYLGDVLFEPEGGIWGQKPFAKIEDFKGVKIRTSGWLQTNTVAAMGGSTLAMHFMELADAISRGTIDAITTSLFFGAGIGLTDVTSHVSLWLVTSVFPCHIIVNKDKFYALPPDLQEIVREWGLTVTRASVSASLIHRMTTMKWLERAGMTVVVPDKAEIARAGELAKSSIDMWREKVGPTADEILATASKYATGPCAK